MGRSNKSNPVVKAELIIPIPSMSNPEELSRGEGIGCVVSVPEPGLSPYGLAPVRLARGEETFLSGFQVEPTVSCPPAPNQLPLGNNDLKKFHSNFLRHFGTYLDPLCIYLQGVRS